MGGPSTCMDSFEHAHKGATCVKEHECNVRSRLSPLASPRLASTSNVPNCLNGSDVSQRLRHHIIIISDRCA